MGSGFSQQLIASKVAERHFTHAYLLKIEARLRRGNDAELLVLAKVLICAVADLYPAKPGNLSRMLRQSRG